jgi:hypothetical protein
MSDFMLDQYEEYLDDFKAWGREFHKRALTYNQFERLKLEQEELELQHECGEPLSEEQRARQEEIERLLLTHDSFFANGPRVTVTSSKCD